MNQLAATLYQDRVNESSTAKLSVSFTDFDGESAVPSSITYRVDDVGSGEQLRDDTAIAAASEIEITLTPSDNAIINQDLDHEIREVTVTAAYGSGDQLIDKFRYQLNNLRFVG